MESHEPGDVRVSLRLTNGHKSTAEDLLPLVYDELRKLAAVRMVGEGPQVTLQPTALVHEAYVRLVGGGDPGWNGKAHFFGAAAKAMRQVLVDRSRWNHALKHGGGWKRRSMKELDCSCELAVDEYDFVALDDALKVLEKDHADAVQVVNLRFFAGLSIEDTAKLMQVSDDVVTKKWLFAKAWLHRRLA
jgi:RNA polymerase sigma factor (TIGR02999 family)